MVTFSPRQVFLRTVCWMDGHGGIGLDLRCKKCRARLDPRPRQWRKPPLGYRVLQLIAAALLALLYATVIAAAFSDQPTVRAWLELVFA